MRFCKPSIRKIVGLGIGIGLILVGFGLKYHREQKISLYDRWRIAKNITIESKLESTQSTPKKFADLIDGLFNQTVEDEKEYDLCLETSARMPIDELEGYIKKLDQMSYREVIASVNTPFEARKLILAYTHRNKIPEQPYWEYSFKQIHENRIEVDCAEAPTIAASVLSDNGYRPLKLILRRNETNHAVFIYPYKEKWGYIDNNMISAPRFTAIPEMVSYMNRLYDAKYDGYAIYDLSKENPKWIDTKKNLFRLVHWTPINLANG